MKNLVQRFLLAILAWSVGVSNAADAVAFLSDLKGEISIDGAARPPLLSELGRGQKLAVGKDSQASVMYIASGKEYVLKGPAEYVVNVTEVAGTTGMPPVTRSTEWRANGKVLVQVAQSSAASVRMRSIAPPKREPGTRLTFPTDGAVATLQPTFAWRAEGEKESGEFILLVSGQEKPVHKGKAVGGTYRLPAKLKPETEYAWMVNVAGSEIGNGRFRTLSSEALQRVEKRRPEGRAEFSDRLLFTLMLHEMGAHQEARESWARLAKERSDLPELSALAN